MTSYTRKLYQFSPSAATELHRQELRDYRYGKRVALATCVTMPANPKGWDEVDGISLPSVNGWAELPPAARSPAPAQFGKRAMPPVLPAYECWAPELGVPKAIVRAADSFAARQEYARQRNAMGCTGLTVTDVAARKVGA